MMLFDRKGSGGLDHLKHLDTTPNKRDFILKMVIQTCLAKKWVEMYGLSVTETMKLEFYDYFMMLKELNKHAEFVIPITRNALDSLSK